MCFEVSLPYFTIPVTVQSVLTYHFVIIVVLPCPFFYPPLIFPPAVSLTYKFGCIQCTISWGTSLLSCFVQTSNTTWRRAIQVLLPPVILTLLNSKSYETANQTTLLETIAAPFCCNRLTYQDLCPFQFDISKQCQTCHLLTKTLCHICPSKTSILPVSTCQVLRLVRL